MTDDIHARVAARCQRADLPVTAAAVAEIDRLLVEETRAEMRAIMASRTDIAIEISRLSNLTAGFP